MKWLSPCSLPAFVSYVVYSSLMSTGEGIEQMIGKRETPRALNPKARDGYSPEVCSERELTAMVSSVGEIDQARMANLLDRKDLARRLSRRNGRLTAMWEDIRDAFRMVKDIVGGSFRDYSMGDLLWIVGGLLYLVNPVDLVPDAIPVVGLADDVGALGIAFSRGRAILQAYRAMLVLESRELVNRTGLPASLKAWFKRVTAPQAIDADLAPGTPLLVALAHVLEHSGVYLGQGQVAELHDGPEGGELRIVPLGTFLCGEGMPRTGRVVYAACGRTGDGFRGVSSESVADYARNSCAESSGVAYNMLRSNCHMFTASCVMGEDLLQCRDGRESVFDRMRKNLKALEDVFRKGSFSIEMLTEVIARELNGGEKVYWCPVKGWTRRDLCVDKA